MIRIPAQAWRVTAILALLVMASGCSQLFGGLRRDMDDQQGQQQAQATYGGAWPEHGWLDDDMSVGGDYADNAAEKYDAVGHSERNPASAGNAQGPSSGSWVTPSDAISNQRDGFRGVTGDGAPSFASAPNLIPSTRRLYKNGSRATAEDFIDDAPNEGSLWASNGQTNYYFTKNQVLGVGDIVSVKIDPAMLKDIGAEVARTLTADEKDAELQAAQMRMDAHAASTAANGAAAAPAVGPAPASVQAGPKATEKDIDVTKSIDMKPGDTIMAEIVERYPNGNYKIRGSKKIIYTNGLPRMLTLVAVAPVASIAQDNSINSGKLYEYRLQAYR